MSAIAGLYTPLKIYTYSGIYINVADPKWEDLLAMDIAMGLARKCRFGGHTKKFYSVAEHSVWCALKAQELYPDDKPLQFALLMHDAHEAYLGDWPTPMVDSISTSLIPGFKRMIDLIKTNLQNAINTRFGISKKVMEDPRVKEIDRLALEWEWENKVQSWKGFQPLEDRDNADIWLEYFKKLVTAPNVIQ
jgi:5'-deoxynucleotidase YfbR-like HD superfamily hydrolase